MTPEVDKIARKIARRFWNDTLKDDSIVNPGFHHLAENSTKNPFEQEVPEEHRDEWLQAMKLMSEYGVFDFAVWEKPDEQGFPFYYKTTNFSHERFVGFCRDFNIDLSHCPVDMHTAVLRIESDNEVLITVDKTTEYHIPPLHASTLVDMLKVALQPMLRGERLTIEKLNAEGSCPDVVRDILDGRTLRIPKSITRLKRYRYDVKIPSFLDEFFILTDSSITVNDTALIDDEVLDEIKKLSDHSTPADKKQT